ncbi:MAG: glycosyltransferase family 4 protein [Reichenbachiella sp.]
MKKVLMLGPGEPNSLNSGLGKAAFEISQRLQSHCDLTIIQPDNLTAIGDIENNISLSKQKIDINQFSDYNVVSEISKLNIEASISPYWNDQNTNRVEIKEQSLLIKQQLITFSKEIEVAGEQVGFDTIYAHDWITFRAAIDLKEKLKKPMTLHVHSLDYDRNCGHQSWVFELEKEAFEKADKIIAVSNYSKGIIETVYGIDADKIHVVHNGYSTRTYPEHDSPFKEKIVLFVGRLTGQKGPTKFLEIAEKINKKYPNSRFIMAGEGDLYKDLIEAGAHSEIASKFHITGYLSEPDLLKTYAMADVYCMPSVSEPFGLTALEAAGAGLPIVLSKNSGASEILENSPTVDFDNSSSFANEIVMLLKNEKLALQHSKKNKETVAKLDWSVTADQIIDILV